MSSQSFDSTVLTIETTGHVATLWLDRPEALNAMGPEFFTDLPRAIAVLDADPKIRVIVIAAKGRHFCAGLDLKAMAGILSAGSSGERPTSTVARNAATLAGIRRMQDSISSVAMAAKPVIAAIHGSCIGGGVDLAAACDIRLASADATFSVREAKVAIVADLGSLQRLPAIIGAGHLAELALSGKDIDAARAAQIGLINDVETDLDALFARSSALAGEIAANSPLAVRGTKAVLHAGDGRTVEEGLDYVARWNTMFLTSNDLAEAMSAFAEKRMPRFDGT